MDTTKWKSVLMPSDIYEEVVVIARVEGRTISGQLRYITEAWKQDNLTKNDQAFIKDEVAKYYSEKEGGKALTSKSFSI
jgi:hypothetical protein